uniref:Prolactin family 2, subfamily C, member 1 n=1 Tax=Rattus norvegicus TaxID=10116 RepID=A0A8I5ZRV4_RAT
MQLSLTQPSSWILLLLVTNLFLWKNVASVPFCAMRNVRCFMFLEDMFDLAGSMSHNISIEVSEMFTEFYGALLKSAHMVLKAWKSPLNDLVRQISTLKNIPDTIISKATDIKLKINSVEQGVNSIINRMLQNGDEERNYPAWSSLPIFKSNDEDASIRSFYGMISCLDNDCKKVDIYLNVLKCYVLQMDNC